MQNIRLCGNYKLDLGDTLVVGCSPDAVGERLFLLGENCSITVLDRSNFEIITALKEPAAFQGCNKFVAFRYNEENSASAVAITTDGNFYFVRVNATDKIEVECAAKLDEGVAAASWAPDGDVCALITQTSIPRLMLITSKLDTIIEKPLIDKDEQPESAAVSIGWGKKETQFHASEGRSAAFASHQQSTPAHPFDDHAFRICWRPDGQFFVVHFVNPGTGCRDFRVYNRNGSLFSLMEPSSGIGQASTWRPYSVGGLIAASCQTKKCKAKVAFFEKNGLQRGEFELPFDSESIAVSELCCNTDGKLLYVTCQDLPNAKDKNTYVLVYTTANFHWYLKHMLTFPTESFGKLWIDGLDKPNRLYIAAANSLHVYEWGWCVDRDQKHNCVGVVDGADFLLTPYKLCAPPPPMYHVRCQLPPAISAVAFCTGQTSPAMPITCLAAVSSDGTGQIYEYDYRQLDNEPKIIHSFQCRGNNDLRCLQLFRSSQQLVGTYVTTAKFLSSIVHVFWPQNDKQPAVEIPVEGMVVACASDPDGQFCVIELDNGKLFQLEIESMKLAPFDNPQAFSRRCSQVFVAKLRQPVGDGQHVAVGLCSPINGSPLYFGRVNLSASATSVVVDERFLVFTTTEHRAYFVPLCSTSAESLVSWFVDVTSGPSTPLQALLTRPVERGALVFAIDTLGDGSIVLEMPRGNVEKIHPRPLLLESVVRNINEKKAYRKAFDTCLKHRISLNFLYDLNPEQFEANISQFCTQLASVENLNLFILDLVDDNVVETLYPSITSTIAKVGSMTKQQTVKRQPNEVGIKSSYKVDRICDLLAETLKKTDEPGFYLAILTCYAKRKLGADLESAIAYLKSLADKYPEQRMRLLDDGLKHLARLADVNDLYDVALGTYDLDLALTVAERTQKDPREYRQELADFSKFQPIPYRKYKIDRRIARLEAAVRNLVEAGEPFFDELFNFVTVEKPKMLLFAAKLFEQQDLEVLSDERRRALWSAYIERLASERRFLEAGLCALRIELYEDAFLYFGRCHVWDLAVVAACHLKAPETKASEGDNDEDVNPCRDAAESATDANDFTSAGRIYEHILGNYEMALQSYIEGHDLFSAYKLLSTKLGKSLGEIRAILESSALQLIDQQLASFAESITELNEFSDRLVAIDSNKQANLAFPYGDADLVVGEDYAESVAAPSTTASSAVRSTTSRGSARSTSSSKSSRQSASRWKLKAGSPTERFAIMERLTFYCKDRLPNWRKDVEEIGQVCFLILTSHHIWSSSANNPLKRLLDVLKEAIAALRRAVDLAWNSEYLASLAAAAVVPDIGECSNALSQQPLLDERIRYSPMCFIFAEEGRISNTSSSNIYNVLTRLL